mmetsp:Transcript_16726/g.21972  ORF Transcript_16726/g.21972 Transcript_16726/m.21972 type:complete len:247 (-) Transcript_16726:232-972(-)|eukprot:CAMPEP_0195281468 /NCGR_PEP_ID=MMETSP0707-20130614/761_1 /TAXON_ID=33640 /ORGANISM="Asterionellopsis glacialis, Strain CCMP134" /LENGTH=246 /DNA_ID=CAMNT_0040340351 /DNA_START=53 /DNA_END=793 /DNA_ORIENTATION=+
MTENGAEKAKGLGPNCKVVSHPIIDHKLSKLRSSSTTTAAFRAILKEITYLVGYEATKDLKTTDVQLTVPVGHDHMECTGKKIADRVALVPILRSGLGMIDSMRELVPKAPVHHIGMYRAHKMPVQYYQRLPQKCESDVAFILDPVIATASTIMSLISILQKWGVPKIHVIAVIGSRQGVENIMKKYPDVMLTVGVIDEELNKDGIVLPGLGDAGDRLFGTDLVEDDEEELMHPSKRKRSASVDIC